MSEKLRDAALRYHREPSPGKLSVVPKKSMVNQRDLALAYSPGVAIACEEIAAEEHEAAYLTGRSNLVAVVSNGTAVLGLGNIGPLASKPVMEGKAALFKKFADVDVFDLEVNEHDIDRFVDIVAALEPTFGGINLEDIKAPQCFEIEERLKARMSIPVFHDDQHGTAICVAAGVRNALRLADKRIESVKLVCSGAGAAALACLKLLVSMGLRKENIRVLDRKGVIHTERDDDLGPYKSPWAVSTPDRTLDDAIVEADIFLGLSGPGTMNGAQVSRMAEQPLVFALANPTPEILPEEVKAVRDDAIVATGRSDYPNQINNVLCFPFLFRGALDCGATEINDAMKIACVDAIAELATQTISDAVARAYGGEAMQFGREYLIPKPFDPRLMTQIPVAVARAAESTGAAARPIADYEAYTKRLQSHVTRSAMVMRPVFERASANPQRVAFAEGESRLVLSAVQEIIDHGLCRPVLIGRGGVVEEKIEQLGLRMRRGDHFDLVDMDDIPNYEQQWKAYHDIMGREGVSPGYARFAVRTNSTSLASLLLHQGEVDAMVCGSVGSYMSHFDVVKSVVGVDAQWNHVSSVMLLVMDKGSYFITDTHITPEPSAEQIAVNARLASTVVRNFGKIPRIALTSHSNFGSRPSESALKMRRAREIINERWPDILVDGEMHADSALDPDYREEIFPNTKFGGAANLMVMPDIDSAHIAYNMVKVIAEAAPVGPMLVGLRKPAYVVTNSIDVEGLVNIAAIAAVDASQRSSR